MCKIMKGFKMIQSIQTFSSNNVQKPVAQAKHQQATNESPSEAKDSFIKRNKIMIGTFAGGLVGEGIWRMALKKRVKNLTTAKELGISLALDLTLGVIGGFIANSFGKND